MCIAPGETRRNRGAEGHEPRMRLNIAVLAGSGKVSFIQFQTGLFQKLSVFLHKGFDPMMFRLIFNILDQRRFIREAMRECGVTILPTAKLRKQALLFDPFRRGHFHRLHKVSNRNGRMQINQKVNVILDTPDAVEHRVEVLNDSPDVSKQLLTPALSQHRSAIFGRKNDMINKSRVGGHVILSVTNGKPLFNAKSIKLSSLWAERNSIYEATCKTRKAGRAHGLQLSSLFPLRYRRICQFRASGHAGTRAFLESSSTASAVDASPASSFLRVAPGAMHIETLRVSAEVTV